MRLQTTHAPCSSSTHRTAHTGRRCKNGICTLKSWNTWFTHTCSTESSQPSVRTTAQSPYGTFIPHSPPTHTHTRTPQIKIQPYCNLLKKFSLANFSTTGCLQEKTWTHTAPLSAPASGVSTTASLASATLASLQILCPCCTTPSTTSSKTATPTHGTSSISAHAPAHDDAGWRARLLKTSWCRLMNKGCPFTWRAARP
jgi:hypothetical protein